MTAGPGTILGARYELVRPLAAGGMGTVWLGRHVELETEVAIKLVEGAHAKRPDLLERFRREARAAAQLKTPHVVSILDYGTDDGTPYIAMELLDGEDLEALLAREETLSPARVLEILRPLCRALEMAHAAGIVHRDLKPANVFVARVAGDEVIKLVDFGIAKELHRGAEHTTGAAVVGSPLFMSPEQIDEKSAVDARTDVWSLGVMVHLMLTGTTPFVATTIASILYKIVHEPLELPSVHARALAPFDDFFTRSLARSVDARYATVGELLAAYEAALAHVDAPGLAIPSHRSAAAPSATLPMSPSDAPSAEAFVARPSAPPLPTVPAVPVDVVEAPVAGDGVAGDEVELAAVASGDDGAVARAADDPSRAREADEARSRSVRTVAKRRSLPSAWIVGGLSVAIGAVVAAAVLFSGADAHDAAASASASVSAAAPVRRAVPRRPKEARAAAPEASASPSASGARSASPAAEPPLPSSATPAGEDGSTSSAIGGSSAMPGPSADARVAPPPQPPMPPAPGPAATDAPPAP